MRERHPSVHEPRTDDFACGLVVLGLDGCRLLQNLQPQSRRHDDNAVAAAAEEVAAVHHDSGFLAAPCATMPAPPASTGAGAEDQEFSVHDGRELRSRPIDLPSTWLALVRITRTRAVALTSASIDPGAPDEGATGLQK